MINPKFLGITFLILPHFASACLPHWQDKPLLIRKVVPENVKHAEIGHNDIELVFTFGNSMAKVQRFPSPTGIASDLAINLSEQIPSNELCIYPRYQYAITAEHIASDINITFNMLPGLHQELGQALLKWNTDAGQAIPLYLDILKKANKSKDPLLPRIWLTTLSAYFKLGQYNRLRAFLKENSPQLTPRMTLKTLFIKAEMALYEKAPLEAIKALHQTEALSEQYKLTLNEQIKQHLLFSTAYFDIGKIDLGKQNLDIITKKINQQNNADLISKKLLANYYDNLGHYHLALFYDQGESKTDELFKGIEYEYKALAITAQSGSIKQKISIHSNVAWLFKSAWRLNSAIRNYNLALSYLKKKPDPIFEVYIHRNLGITYLSFGSYEKALAYLEQAHTNAQNLSNYWEVKLTCLIGTAKRNLGRLEESRINLLDCIKRFKSIIKNSGSKDRHSDLTDAQIELARTLSKLGDRAGIRNITEAIRSRVSTIKNNDVATKASLWLANSAANQGRSASAIQLFKLANRHALSASDPAVAVSASIESSLWAMTTKFKNIFPIENALQKIEQTSSELDAAELGPAWSNKVNHFFTEIIDYYLQTNATELAFNWFERSRAISLRKVKKVQKDVQNQTTAELYLQKLSELTVYSENTDNKRLNRLRLAEIKDLLNLNRTRDGNDPQRMELEWYQERKAELRFAERPLVPSIELSKLQRNLTSKQLLFAYFESNNHVHLFVVSANHFSHHAIGRLDEIKSLIQAASFAVSDPERYPWDALKSLSKVLLPDDLLSLNAKQLVIIPHGALNSVPFAALPISSKRHMPLVSTHTLVQVPSATIYWSSLEAAKPIYSSDFTMFGDPITASSLGNHAHKIGMLSKLPPLPWSRVEATSLNNIFSNLDKEFFLKERASRKNFTQPRVRSSRILHIATHSFYDERAPQNAGFTLSIQDEEGKSDPGFVTFSELTNYRFNNQLVVINGCESARGKTAYGEGWQGMARGFLVSGSKNVIATAWPISDRVSSYFITQFYQGVSQNLSFAKSLQNAQLNFINSGRYKHPFYWSAYTLFSVTDSHNSFN